MAGDETALPRIEQELETSQELAGQLLDNLAQKLRRKRAARHAASGLERAAHYVQAYSMKRMATEVGQLVRRQPAASLFVAAAAGLLIGLALRPKGPLR